jgi:hypothetical protein
VHQVGLKGSGSQNFTFLAFKEKAVGVIQILCTTATVATAYDGRKKIIAQIMLFIHKKSKIIKISEKLF